MGEETEEEAVVRRVNFEPGEEAAFVKVSAGKTISLGAGSYEFLRLDVSVTLPCHTQDIHSAYEEASDFVLNKLSEQEAAWMGATNTPHRANRRGR